MCGSAATREGVNFLIYLDLLVNLRRFGLGKFTVNYTRGEFGCSKGQGKFTVGQFGSQT
jgi:hypothetical protein